jgi:glycosyltransferase involved in cell wall biosynthesis
VITVAITTFNRSDIVGRAVRSALAVAATVSGKVVLVDDGSTDDTQIVIKRDFQSALSDCTLTYFRHETNLGVTAAKNSAFAQSSAGWVLFLDSDDEFIQESALAVAAVLLDHNDEALVFFRCVDQAGTLVGRRFDAPQRLSLPRYTTHTSYGEALVAINKAVTPAPPFDADLRGYEGIGCARIIKRFGPALLATVVGRRYDRSRNDRLSGFLGTLKRAGHLARGHLRYISLCGNEMRPTTRLALRIKALVYFSAELLRRVLWFRNGRCH